MGKEREKQRGYIGAWGTLSVSRPSGGRTLSCGRAMIMCGDSHRGSCGEFCMYITCVCV